MAIFNYITILLTFGLLTLTTARPYIALGSSQLDVRNNYNTGSGYSTSLGYASPLQASRIVASASPFAYTTPFSTRYTSSPSVLAGPYGFTSVPARYESPLLGAGYASPYAAPFASPYAQAVTSNFASAYPAAYGSPYAISAPGSAQILL